MDGKLKNVLIINYEILNVHLSKSLPVRSLNAPSEEELCLSPYLQLVPQS